MQQVLQQLKSSVKGIAGKPFWRDIRSAKVTPLYPDKPLTKADLSVREARLVDVDDIHRLLVFWTAKGETLPRSKDNILQDIGDFVVAEVAGKVVGCAAIYVYQTGLAELRSVAVDGDYQGLGQGRAMSEFLLAKAKSMAIPRVVVLTRAPQFFAKLGFTDISIKTLPEKINKDCKVCPKQAECDEVAMEFLIQTHPVKDYKGQKLIVITA